MEDEDASVTTDRPSSPKYTMSEKWMLERQKRKLLTDKMWALKQRKTEQRIAVCTSKLKVDALSILSVAAYIMHVDSCGCVYFTFLFSLELLIYESFSYVSTLTSLRAFCFWSVRHLGSFYYQFVDNVKFLLSFNIRDKNVCGCTL